VAGIAGKAALLAIWISRIIVIQYVVRRLFPEGRSLNMSEEIKNVFISHVHEDDEGLADLKELIAKGGLTVRDSSINSSKPNDAKDPTQRKKKEDCRRLCAQCE
jgi:hypothetical protein